MGSIGPNRVQLFASTRVYTKSHLKVEEFDHFLKIYRVYRFQGHYLHIDN